MDDPTAGPPADLADADDEQQAALLEPTGNGLDEQDAELEQPTQDPNWTPDGDR